MRYARTDIHSYIPPGGICPGHTEPADPEEDLHFSVDCVICDPLLAQDPLWAGHPDAVPLTEVEQQRADKAAMDAQEAQARFAMAMAQAGLHEASRQLAAAQTPPAIAPPASPPANEPAAAPARKARAPKARAPKQQPPAQQSSAQA
jgi:hypothetical protein